MVARGGLGILVARFPRSEGLWNCHWSRRMFGGLAYQFHTPSYAEFRKKRGYVEFDGPL